MTKKIMNRSLVDHQKKELRGIETLSENFPQTRKET